MSENPAPPPREVLIADGQSHTFDRLMELLSKGSVNEEHGRLRWSSNFTFLMSVCDDTLKLKAIYKPQRGERPLWDFPDGTLCYREAAAFAVSEALNWSIVPPTVLREGSRGLGSIQLYIEHDPEITYFNLGTSFLPQLARFAAFDYITNNADRKGGHCLLGAGSKLWGIDHGICFHTVPKLRTVIWNFAGEALEAEMLKDVERFIALVCDKLNPLRQNLETLISTAEIEAMINRSQRMLRAGKFPQPGHGPTYPWPPI